MESSLTLDTQKVAENKKITTKLEANQKIQMSGKIIKINHVNRHQERILLITTNNIYNIYPPNMFFGANKLKRKMPFNQILGLTISRYGSQFVIHIDKEDDYRCQSINLKLKFVEVIVACFCKANHQKMPIHYYDDLTLEIYTTTIDDIAKKRRKIHKEQPILLDAESIKKNQKGKAESKLLFKSKNSENIQTFEEFEIVKVLGRGAFGKVMLCKDKKNEQYFAVKSMRKEQLIERESIQRTKTQRYLLEKVQNPFLVSLEYAFQTKEKIFLVMKFYQGGEMFTRLKKEKRFGEKRAKFYAAQVYLALKYLHELGYAYRDLKPENILFDDNGYLRLSDYGLAKHLKADEKTFSITGTPSYLSPEVIMSQGHSFAVDWWALGILIFQMIYGYPPFYSKDQKQMFHNIVNKNPEFDDRIAKASDQCKSIMKQLLKKYPEKRLGTKDNIDIKNHAWFSDFDFTALQKFQIAVEYIPQAKSQEDVSNFHESFTQEEPINTIVNTDNILLNKYEKDFEGFDYTKFNKLIQNSKTQSTNFTNPNFNKKKKQTSENL